MMGQHGGNHDRLFYLAYRWFCRLGRFRDSDAFRQLFETVVERCIGEGLVGGEGVAIHASIIRADGTFSVSDFHWDEQANEYRCPPGEPLRCDWRTFDVRANQRR